MAQADQANRQDRLQKIILSARQLQTQTDLGSVKTLAELIQQLAEEMGRSG